MALLNECKSVKKEFCYSLLDKENVVSVGVGYKVTNGEKTDELCVIVGVVKKVPLTDLNEYEVIPAALLTNEGVATTDVVETGIIQARALTDRVRPVPGGYSIGHWRITSGTLGVWVKRGDQPLILSNNHVLADSNNALIGSQILQPGVFDGGQRAVDLIARLDSFVKINFLGEKFEGSSKGNIYVRIWRAIVKFFSGLFGRSPEPSKEIKQPRINLVDAALALPASDTFVAPTIFEDQQPVGIRDVDLGTKVHKTGRTTGRTDGEVSQIDMTISVRYSENPRRTAIFEDQYEIAPVSFSAGGDSGSAILDEDGYLVGLLFAGSSIATIANKISNVVKFLGVKL